MRPHGKLEYGGQAVPLRTCVGCRVRTVSSELLRLVVVEGVILPDLRRRLQGRGASLHPTLSCLELAERRRAFPRAFRVAVPLDLSRLRGHLEEQQAERIG
ncbi:YlxR family protein [Streptosporangium sp. NBC_01755]|uniref:YlxR family protein n=1 Tax=unclassified Streptosporangium TaxID=2632669 RepID=UPI002DD91CF5|nr:MULTISPECIES: YlxR family protein [unclassified Streptosporangium]WSA23499.1 YlxR family protein [Streptosporangium sp. NBC_01810]WSC98293.1 YlxR family protein [Streptosporangium sp. NBC_01755]